MNDTSNMKSHPTSPANKPYPMGNTILNEVARINNKNRKSKRRRSDTTRMWKFGSIAAWGPA